jgi:adenosine deaminase
MDFHQLPKVELHLHLDCSLSYSVVSHLNPAITRTEYLESFVTPAGCPGLADILSYAAREIELMQTEEALRLVTLDLFEQLRQDNMLYAEIRFAPLLHTEKGLSAEDVVSIVDAAVQTASQQTGIEARVLLCTLRHYSETQSLETVQLVERFKGTSVVGFDIGGDEVNFPLDAHIAAFQYARAHDIPCTAHAGEARGPESVWETLQHLTPLRIGHGYQSIKDPALLEHLRQRQIHLEVCPTSNVHVYHQTFKTFGDHPIDTLYGSGISLSVNSDSRTLIPATLTQEYEKLHQAFGWEKEQFLQCNLDALRAAFVPELVKQQLIDRLLEAYRI